MQTGVVRETGQTQVERYQAATAILPDGTVLTAGGTAIPGAYAPEIWSPVTEVSTLMAQTLPGPDRTARAYHSVALLLIDGSVLWGGGNPASLCKTFERFLPPYLFKGPRPSISMMPGQDQIQYGGLATFSTPDADIDQMVLMRPGVSSHGCNFESKRIVCPFFSLPGLVQMQVPSSSNVAPPGWYMVFALRGGVPSIGQWVRVVFP